MLPAPRRLAFLLAALVSAAPGRAAAAGLAETSQGRRPPLNFVVVMADDLGAWELGCYGDSRGLTPNLDALAASGVRFETCYATPLCTPSRFEILTGQYGFRNGYLNFLGNDWTPRLGTPQVRIENHVTFAEVLGAGGYRTAVTGKWQLPDNGPELVRSSGFDEYLIWKWRHGLESTDDHDAAQRVGTDDLPSRFWGPVMIQDGELRTGADGEYGPDLYTEFVLDFARRHKKAPFLAYYPMTLTHQPWEMTPDTSRAIGRSRPGFASNLEYLDELVGRIVKGLTQAGLRRRTVVIFTADNGSTRFGKGDLTERGVRVPLIVSCPGRVPEGEVSRALADLSDVLPTLADLAGVEVPADHVVDGRSFAPVLRGEAESHREWIFSYLEDRRLVRTDRWLLEGTGRLFDCGADRTGEAYVDVTKSTEPEVEAARRRIARILEALPVPTDAEALRIPAPGEARSTAVPDEE